jgi:hypothetical protein
LSYRPQHQEGGGHPCHQVFASGLLGCRWAQGAAYGHILAATTLVGECPSMMATVARRFVATSVDRGCPLRQFHPCRTSAFKKPFTQYSTISVRYIFMLSFEMVGPSGSLSMLLSVAASQWRDASQIVNITATSTTTNAGYHCTSPPCTPPEKRSRKR